MKRSILQMGKQQPQTAVQTATPAPTGLLPDARAALQAEITKLDELRQQSAEVRNMTSRYNEGVTVAEQLQNRIAAEQAVLLGNTLGANIGQQELRVEMARGAIRDLELHRSLVVKNFEAAQEALKHYPTRHATTIKQFVDLIPTIASDIRRADPALATMLADAQIRLGSVFARYTELQAQLDSAQRRLVQLGE